MLAHAGHSIHCTTQDSFHARARVHTTWSSAYERDSCPRRLELAAA